ncbi:MAG: aminodeoxychorismate synthase component I [Candidatus Omnitrophica bacterium]|nr:aminodeoxychorismate synthase component I [Candidatus Omnitrophota bacterium]
MNNLLNCLHNLKPPYVFLETLAKTQEEKSSFIFSKFKDIITFGPRDDLDLFFKKLESYSRKGYWLVGYFSYEFGYFLEEAHRPLRAGVKTPIAWVGVCKEPRVISNKKKIKQQCSHFSLNKASYEIRNIRPNISQKEYNGKIKKIKYYLKQGLTYQVNFTFKEKFDFKGNVVSLYSDLRKSQPTSYSALINTTAEQILSLSPELFFKIDKNKIIARPMKGTIKRGETKEKDCKNKNDLRNSKKIRAENLMIVDLLRNDLGRISELVRAPKLFDIEKHPTLYQMTSTIEGKLKKNVKLKEMFSSLFPCGSVTGAPKIKTIELIKALEKEPRGVYTGAIGYISPKKKSCFNVAIRTVRIKKNKGELGIGGGIVYDSKTKDEYEEALLKGKFFREGLEKIGLIESILWDKSKGYLFLSLHLKRLKNSSKYFSYPYREREIKNKLKEIIKNKRRDLKVSLVLDSKGNIDIKGEPIKKIKAPIKIRISQKRIDSRNTFLYHKTTKRAFYDQERSKGLAKGYFETIFLNERGELAEGAISNIFILKNKKLYTPVAKSGLLPGILREQLIREGKVKEKTLYLKDLEDGDKIYIGNSVRNLLLVKKPLFSPMSRQSKNVLFPAK